MPTEDRRVGKLLPNPVTPPSTICFMIEIPNAVQYRAAFLGQINVLGNASTWDHPRDGTDCAPCEEAAQLWRNAIYNAVWGDECGGMGMSCDDIADCIETSEAVQDAIAQQIASNPSNQTNIYETSVYGAPMSAARASETVAVSSGCDNDALFGSISEIVDQLDTNNRDFLEVIEVGTNTRERVSTLIAAVPILETFPANELIDLIDKLQSEILENYEAQWTSSLRDEYRCGLFCIALEKPGCELSFADLFEYWNNRLGASLEPVNFATAVLNYFLLGTWAGTTVVDIMTLIQLGVWREASSWTGVSLRTLQTVGLLGANNPDSDWEILCEECAEPPANPWEIFAFGGNTSVTWGEIVNQTSNSITAKTTLSSGYHRLCIAKNECVEVLTVTAPAAANWVKQCGGVDEPGTVLAVGDTIDMLVMADPVAERTITFTW